MGYVEKVRLLDYWKIQDTALQSEFPRSRLVLMVDRRLLVTNGPTVKLVEHKFADLRQKLGDYGLQFDMSNSCLLDAVEEDEEANLIPLFGTSIDAADPPEDSPISKKDVLKKLGDSLGGRFTDVRMAMLTIGEERQRNLLAKFQSLTKWAAVYRRCPKCAAALKMRTSKSGAECVTCQRVYYPTFSPVSITLITDPTNEHALLVRHRGSAGGVFTAVAGFAHSGESMAECARREIAEEVGIEVESIRSLNMSQPWPMPDSSLMVAHHAVAKMDQKISVCPDELETAQWFSREQVRQALDTTLADPFLKKLPRTLDDRQTLHYIPPVGAIAHQMISQWLNGKMERSSL
uniref:NAD(+) diphosphatase n=1 Tax=Caenorhabditis japonica TaxID=281687 RepID=A0A8R1DFF8_CAEJA